MQAPILSNIFAIWYTLFIQDYFGVGEGNRAPGLCPSLHLCPRRDKGVDAKHTENKTRIQGMEMGVWANHLGNSKFRGEGIPADD